MLFGQTFRFPPLPGAGPGVPVADGFVPWLVGSVRPNELIALESLGYFGGLFLINGWGKLAVRDRKARFRIWPVIVTALCATLLWPLWPTPEPYGVAVAALVAIVTQLVSPWNEAAAAYARANRKRKCCGA